MNFEAADRALRDMNKRNLRAFDRLKTLKFDELNVMGEVGKVYDDSVRLARKRYQQIAYEAFLAALIEAMIAEAKARELAEDSITEDWVLDMLEEYDPVTLYQFFPEVERKKQRTVEAIIASHNKSEVIDRALRLWTQQVAHYADKSVDEATLDGYKEAGVKKIRWVTERDDRVCDECRKRDGKTYTIDKIPPRPHYRCRCTWTPVLD